MIPTAMKRGVVAVFLTIAFVLQGTTSVLAGTTGSITGTVVDSSTNQPIAGAHVTATSPSQSSTATTDASGRFSFVSLSPDTYTISVAATDTRDLATVSGITILADQTQSITLTQPAKLKQIGSVTSRAASALVKAGTTADVYSINAATQDKASAFGGGANINSAWSAIASVPGVYIAPNQAGYLGAGSSLGGSVSIRGGDYDQIGYELDGIPVNRSFDNYPSGAISSLGQQELQVYTGATPANAEASGLSGYINQVIRTGTAPAYRSLDLAVGSPTFYNKLAFETGGANPARTFSYYVGLGGYNQSYRYADQFNGASLSREWGGPIAPCSGVPAANYTPAVVPSCFSPSGQDYTNGGVTPAYALGPYTFYAPLNAAVLDRDSVLNVHFGIPRSNGNKDDVQVLFDNNSIRTPALNSTNDLGGAAYLNAIGFGVPTYADGMQIAVPYGTVLPQNANYANAVSTYMFPLSPVGRPLFAPIDDNARDALVNDQSVVKVQYQRNFGTSAFLRLYGYTYYSDWLQVAPQSTVANYIAAAPSDYELNAHTRGLSATFSDQINAQHLLTVQGAYTTASSMRYNNSQIGNFSGTFGYLVNGNDPYSGICYTAAGAAVPGCNFSGTPFQTISFKQVRNGTVVTPTGTCGTGPCQYVVVAGGPSATFNTVKPKFSSFSLTDNWRPTDRLNLNVGLRFDRFEFQGADTLDSGARTLFYNAYNLVNPTTPLFNESGVTEAYNVWQPRVGLTYSMGPQTVVRASYGRYAEAPNSAFEQYNYLQPNDLGKFISFGKFGLPTTPSHAVRPQISNNYDLSLEHQFPGQLAVKLTPFYRKTQDQIQNFFLDQKTNFISGLNVGRQTSEGLEFEVDKGDFARDGLSGRLTFTYTNSFINYSALPNGSTVISPINAAIANYNAYTSFCATNPTDARCTGGATASGVAAPCYTTAGAPDPACAATSVANPYWNAPVQALIDPNSNFPTFSTFPGPIEVGYTTESAPFTGTMLVQWKHGPFSVTPALQFSGGTKYGVPETTPGIQPDTCTGTLGPAAGDPRYNYGAPGGAGYDAATCPVSGLFAIPELYTKQFDGLGSFVEPNQLQLHVQLSYDVSKRLTLVGNFANVYTRCWGGRAPVTIPGACGYTQIAGAGSGPMPVGNAYNPGDVIQPMLNYPYYPSFGGYPFAGLPFSMFIEARLKI